MPQNRRASTTIFRRGRRVGAGKTVSTKFVLQVHIQQAVTTFQHNPKLQQGVNNYGCRITAAIAKRVKEKLPLVLFVVQSDRQKSSAARSSIVRIHLVPVHNISHLRTQEGGVSSQGKGVRSRGFPRGGVRMRADALDVGE